MKYNMIPNYTITGRSERYTLTQCAVNVDCSEILLELNLGLCAVNRITVKFDPTASPQLPNTWQPLQ